MPAFPQGLYKKFKQRDVNKDGTLNSTEFARLLDHPIAGPFFIALDVDNSGTLGFPELARAVALSQTPAEQRCRMFFKVPAPLHTPAS